MVNEGTGQAFSNHNSARTNSFSKTSLALFTARGAVVGRVLWLCVNELERTFRTVHYFGSFNAYLSHAAEISGRNTPNGAGRNTTLASQLHFFDDRLFFPFLSVSLQLQISYKSPDDSGPTFSAQYNFRRFRSIFFRQIGITPSNSRNLASGRRYCL